ncbi:MAG: hypothetical protein L0322_29160, partial [Chloroflexi bacterium]|nr:hypothetical protein [Chloroflexota bacterium]
MASLKLSLLGPLRIELDGVLVKVSTRKATALLAFLAVTRQSHSREALATLFWPELDQTRAHASLRSTLWALNKALGEEWLVVDRKMAGLQSGADLTLDVAVFRDRITSGQTHGHLPEVVCPVCLSSLAEAVELYGDGFLAGFTLPDSPAFDEWSYYQAEELRQAQAGALARLVSGYVAQGEFEVAIPYARRWLALDPLHEPAHRSLMQLYAWTGQRAAALRQYQACVELLDKELGITPQAETRQLYETIRDQRELPPPINVVGDQLLYSNLGAHLPSTPFVGREEELAEIGRCLANPQCRLLTISGPGGIGKTRLALQAATLHQVAYEHGATFVPLAAVASPAFLISAIADALAFQLSAGRDPKVQLLSYLRRRNLLLVLDNFEHLLDGTSLLSDILAAAPQVKVVVTSRTRLNVTWERTLNLRGLHFPTEEDVSGVIERFSAVQLFLYSARRVNWNFALSAAERPGVLRLCQMVEGMPLGLELAASWVRVIPCAEIAQEIEHDLGFLATSLQGLPERQRSLRVVMAYSWKQLPDAEKRVFRMLSVFRGGFGREAAGQVAGASLAHLTMLVDHSFLYRISAGRFEVHELLRQFGAEELEADRLELEEAHDRHGRYFAAVLQERESRLKGRGQGEAIREIEEEIDNVRVAWRRAVERRKSGEIGQALDSLFHFLRARNLFQEAWDAFHTAAEAFRRSGEEQVLLLGRILAREGVFAELLGQFDSA